MAVSGSYGSGASSEASGGPAHRNAVRVHVDELLDCLAVLDAKIAGYGGDLNAKVEQ